MKKTYVWDIIVRLFHWIVATSFVANAVFTDPEGSNHRWFGYAIAAALAIRLVWGFVGSTHARFADFPPSANRSLAQLAEIATHRRVIHKGHSPLGSLMIYNLLLSLAGICVTGYMMTTVAYFGVEWVEEAHEILVTWAEISVVVHVFAVIFESRRLGVNLPQSMVTGYKKVPQN